MAGTSLDIPSYEEATSSRTNARNDGWDSEEMAGLSWQSGYRPPTVESIRSSMDSSFLEGYSARSSVESLQREMVQMDIEEPPSSSSGRLAYQSFTKRISNFTNSISSSFSSFRFSCFKFRLLEIPCMRIAEKILPYYRIVGALFAIFIIYILLASGLFNFGSRAFVGQLFDPESVQRYAISQLDKSKLKNYLGNLTKFGHVAGTEGDLALARYIKAEFNSIGLDAVEEEEYHVYLNYPKRDHHSRKLAIVSPPHLAWEAKLEEIQLAHAHNPGVFHGYSRSGDVKGPLIYANFSSLEDYARLAAWGVNVTGAVVIARHGGSSHDPGMKVKAAEMAGAIGCLLYNDGALIDEDRGWEFPDAGISNMNSYVQRDSVALMSYMVGDVLTPGYASTKDAPRKPKINNPALVNIPSLPISWRNAQHLISTLEGHGARVDIKWEEAETKHWWTGNQSSPIVHIVNNLSDQDNHPIWNVLGLVRGLEQNEKKIIVGNHRDAWCYGAASPNSGTAVMLEVARIFGVMMSLGWRPLRSIIFASWDGGEYNRVGSTEWVEEHVDELRRNGMAYINLGTGVSGWDFRAAGSPPLESVLLKTLQRVQVSNPHDSRTNVTVLDYWANKEFKGLGAGGDYAAFQHFAGVSSIDIGFHGQRFPYHSCYDTYDSLMSYDGDFVHHHMLGQILALLILELADTANMPFNMTNYAARTARNFADLEKYVADQLSSPKAKNLNASLELQHLRIAVETMGKNLYDFENNPGDWKAETPEDMDKENAVSAIHRMSHNSRMANFEHHLLDVDGGVPGREFYKHILMAPKKWDGWEPEYFPSIRDSIEMGNWVLAQEMVEKVANKMIKASQKLID